MADAFASPTSSTRRAGRLAKLLLAATSTIVFLALLEGGARLLGLQAGFFLQASQRSCQRRSALLNLEFRPDCTGELAGTRFQTNALGLRGDQVRDDGSVRILAVGDSCTWGWQVAQDQSYPAVLQRLLDERMGAGRHQVINAGVPGYTSYQGLLYLRERGLRLDPHIVIVGFGFNDQLEDGDVEVQLARAQRLMPVLRLDDFLLEQSQLYRWARWQGDRAGSAGLGRRVSPERYKANLEQLVGLARAHGAAPALVSFWGPYGPRKDYRSVLRGVARDQSVALLTYKGARLDIVHPTAEGYASLAGQIYEYLKDAGHVH